MKKILLCMCLILASMAAQAQFEKGKWVVNPSVTGLGMAYDTDADKFSFGAELKGGAFLLDNFALLIHGGARWNEHTNGVDTDVYTMGVGSRYYFAFLLDNFALLIHGGARWNEHTNGVDTDVYTMGVGSRYYFSRIGVYVGAEVNVDRFDYSKRTGLEDATKFSFGMETGYAFFLSRTVTLEPAFYWNVNEDRHKFGLKLGFGLYF